jgi:hypothetical protein
LQALGPQTSHDRECRPASPMPQHGNIGVNQYHLWASPSIYAQVNHLLSTQ